LAMTSQLTRLAGIAGSHRAFTGGPSVTLLMSQLPAACKYLSELSS